MPEDLDLGLLLARNPDTIAKMTEDDVLKMINAVTGGQAPAPPAGSGGSR